jgi:hypothetical protein
MNEFMTGSESTFPVISNLTLSLLEDTGWYGVYNYSFTKTLIWGYKRNCDFATKSCQSWDYTDTDMGYQCTANSPEFQCTFDFRSIGRCNIKFTDQLSDFCTYYREDEFGRCDNPDDSDKYIKTDAGESRDAESRCLYSSLLKINENVDIVQIPQNFDFRCYKTKCKSSQQLMVGIKYQNEYVYYECPLDGGELTIIGYGGKMKCIKNMALSTCAGAKDESNLWPTISNVAPIRNKPGSIITITGTNFTEPMRVIIRGISKNVVTNSPTQIVAQLPSEDAWSTFSDLFERKEAVIVIDSQNRTGVRIDSVIVDLDFGQSLGRAISKNPGWAALIIGGSIAILVGIFCLIYCCCCSGNKKK